LEAERTVHALPLALRKRWADCPQDGEIRFRGWHADDQSIGAARCMKHGSVKTTE
jgi:hypothetical protein